MGPGAAKTRTMVGTASAARRRRVRLATTSGMVRVRGLRDTLPTRNRSASTASRILNPSLPFTVRLPPVETSNSASCGGPAATSA